MAAVVPALLALSLVPLDRKVWQRVEQVGPQATAPGITRRELDESWNKHRASQHTLNTFECARPPPSL